MICQRYRQMIDMNNSRYEVLRLSLGSRDKNIRNGNRFDLTALNNGQIQQRKIVITGSEMTRMMQAVNPDGNCQTDGSEYQFIRDIIELDVGNCVKAYMEIADADGIIYVNDVPYRRAFCSAGDSRSKKAWFCADAQWPKVERIVRCGLHHDQMFTASKINAYDGMIHSTSSPVTMPNIVVIPDTEAEIAGVYDMVRCNVQNALYQVISDRADKTTISLFDGAGLVCVGMAQQWKQDLHLKHLPGAFQFRAIPGLKGVLFTFDIKQFARQFHRSKIKDIWGEDWDLWEDKIDVIMTASQFKFHKLFSSMDAWRSAFESIEYGYKRTFNIAAVSDNPADLKRRKKAKLSYQHLQTLNLSKEEIKQLATPTIDLIEKLHSDVEAFLKYRRIDGCDESGRRASGWARVPPYYKALYYNHDLCNDSFIRARYREDLKSIVNDARIGKLLVQGNYQMLAPDLFGLAQIAFGLEVTGLLEANEIYSQYWLQAGKDKLDLLRNPHIGNEHNLVIVSNTTEMEEWYQYQTASIVTGTRDTIALRCNSADFDGDTVLTTSNPVLIRAVERYPSNTIVPMYDAPPPVLCRMDDIAGLMIADAKAMKCDIGKVVNPVSALWSLAQNKQLAAQVKNYIAIMSVVGSLVIDAAKTGQDVETPEEIAAFLSDVERPYFMRYRRPKGTRKNEKSDKYCGVQNCTMNRVCQYVEVHTEDLSIGQPGRQFDFTALLSGECYKFGKPYQRVKETLLRLHSMYNSISQRFDGISDDSYKRRQYDRFFSNCRVELLQANPNINKTIDIIITLYYTDLEFTKIHNHSILWNAFEGEMVRRAKGDFAAKPIDREKLLAQHERAKQWLEKTHERAKDQVSLEDAVVYDSDVNAIKNAAAPPHEKGICLLVCMLAHTKAEPIVIQKRAKKGNLSIAQLADLISVDRRRVEPMLHHLHSNGLISVENPVSGRYELKRTTETQGGNVIARARTANDVRRIIADAFSGENEALPTKTTPSTSVGPQGK